MGDKGIGSVVQGLHTSPHPPGSRANRMGGKYLCRGLGTPTVSGLSGGLGTPRMRRGTDKGTLICSKSFTSIEKNTNIIIERGGALWIDLTGRRPSRSPPSPGTGLSKQVICNMRGPLLWVCAGVGWGSVLNLNCFSRGSSGIRRLSKILEGSLRVR